MRTETDDNETEEEFARRLGINYDGKRCQARWEAYHRKVIADAKEHCSEIWNDSGGGFFKTGRKALNPNWGKEG